MNILTTLILTSAICTSTLPEVTPAEFDRYEDSINDNCACAVFYDEHGNKYDMEITMQDAKNQVYQNGQKIYIVK